MRKIFALALLAVALAGGVAAFMTIDVHGGAIVGHGAAA
jgi:hypothetical protein